MQTKIIKHCAFCRVCIRNSVVHLPMSRMCLTKQNLFAFIGLCLSMILSALLML